MPDKNRGDQQSKGTPREQQKPLKDLDTRKQDTDRVKGGRAVRLNADPDEGGE